MEQRYLNTRQLAAYLNKSEKSIRSLAFRRQIPYRKPGGRLLFIKEEVDSWIEASSGISLEQWQSETSK